MIGLAARYLRGGGPRRDVNLELVRDFVVLFWRRAPRSAPMARFALGVARARRHADPLELVFERLAPLRRGFFFPGQARLLLLEPRRVVAFEGDAVTTVELQDPAGDVVEKVAVVGDGDDRPLVALQVLLEPLHGLGVEMIRRLVEQQDVGLLNEKTAKRDAAAFAPGEQVDLRIGRRGT